MIGAEAAELKTLYHYVPRLFENAGNLLYVGANKLRAPHHAQTLHDLGWRLHLLEIFPANVRHQQRTNLWTAIILGDVRTAKLSRRYDMALWWHGVEHIPQTDVPRALARLEAAAPCVVLGCPNGLSPQESVYGNDAERHQWSVEAADLEALGYTVVPYRAASRSHLLAWKGQA